MLVNSLCSGIQSSSSIISENCVNCIQIKIYPGTTCIVIFLFIYFFYLCTLLEMNCSGFYSLQFVMFYACALDPEECGVKFATVLADMFISQVIPPLTRYCLFPFEVF